MHKSTKLFDGFSCCFRQWKAETTHCKYLHGYGLSFRVTFDGRLDHRNWVWDFGGMKRAKTKIDNMSPKEWMDHMFDHTVLIAIDDPDLKIFQTMYDNDIIQLRVVEATGVEKFAEFIFKKLNTFVRTETNDRVHVKRVEFMEHNKNTAIYEH